MSPWRECAARPALSESGTLLPGANLLIRVGLILSVPGVFLLAYRVGLRNGEKIEHLPLCLF